MLKEEAFNTLFSLSKKSIFFAWSKGVIYNTFSPSILLDKRIRSLPHPSFYENNRDLKQWLNKLFFDDTFANYKLTFLFSVMTSGIFLVLLFFGILISFKNYFSQSLFQICMSCTTPYGFPPVMRIPMPNPIAFQDTTRNILEQT